jgi:hypothetical protein
METPDELIESVRDQERRGPTGDTVPRETPDEPVESVPGPNPEPPVVIAEGVAVRFSPLPTPVTEGEGPQLTFKRTMLNPLLAMEFTDDMVLEVVNALNRETEEERLRYVS